MLRVDAYFFENGEKISVFKNIGIRVDRALQNVSTCDKQLLGDTGTDDIFLFQEPITSAPVYSYFSLT